MNAAYVTGIDTNGKTVFLATTNSLGLTGFDVDTAEEIIITNFHASNVMLVRIDGFHDAVANAPQGYGAVPTYDGWMPVPPGISIPFRLPDGGDRLSHINRVQIKALSGTVDAGWGVTKHH